MKKTFGDYIVIIFSIIGTYASIFAFSDKFFPRLNDQGVVAVIFLGFLAVFFLGYTIYLIARYRKRIRYSEVFEDINLSFSQIHSLDRNTSTKDDELKLILQSLSQLCDSLSDCFSRINGHQISVCIKFLESQGEHPLVNTLARDKKSKAKGRKTGSSDNTKHWLKENSDFKFIYSNYDNDNIDTSYYYKTYLPNRGDYTNTRLDDNWPPRKIVLLDKLIRQKQWTLKYRCTMVVPIIPLNADEQAKKSLRGFICLDSPHNKAFYKEADIEILRGISDGVYKKIDRILELVNDEKAA